MEGFKLIRKVEKIGLAVIPFASIGGEPNQEYFTDGLTEELIHPLR